MSALDRFNKFVDEHPHLYFSLVILGMLLACGMADTMLLEQPTIIAEASK